MRWITRENIKVDRVACPWAIKRFIDHEAEFMFVPEGELLAAAKREDATRSMQGVGLCALAQGFAVLGLSDEERLRR